MMQSAKTIRLKNMRGRVMNAEVVNLRLVTALCCFAVVSVRHDAVAQYASELGKARQVSQHGVTWKFDREVPVGRFVNGDAYVVGPVTVVDIDPAPVAGRNGSVLNLNPGRGKSGFDSRQNRGNSYDARMRSVPPISMMPGDSLLSSVSCEKQRQFPQMLWPFDPAKGMARCWVRSVSVLTCMAEPQPSDAFRPAFCDRENKVYLARDLHRDLLPKLKPVQGMPSPLEFAKHFQRCWVDVMRQNKAAPAEYAAQYGIDLYGTLEAGWSGWVTLGGHEYKKLDGRANKMKKYKDMRDVFDDSEIDAVFVALPRRHQTPDCCFERNGK